ncbi:MAG: PLP-dependent aminotransferase family protein, partial [Marinobacterium sp.]
AGLKSIPIAVDRQGLQVEQLQQSPHPARAVFLTPSHQFPSGATLSLDRRLALIEWARQHNAWIIEDDYDSEFHYAGKPTACVQGLDPYDRTIYIGTFTKSLFPGLRIGYLVLPPQLVQPLTTARTLIDGHSAPLPQLTLARFMESGHFSAYVRQMRALYAERLRVLVDLVQQHLTGFVEPRPPVGGLQMPCVLTCNTPEADVITAARRQGLDLMGLSGLHASGTGTRGFLLGFAAYTAEELNTAVRTLARVFRKLLK